MVDIKRAALDEYIKLGPAPSQYRENSMVICMPTLGVVHWKVWRCWDEIKWPMNQWRVMLDRERMEVGEAYQDLVESALKYNALKPGGVRFILFREDDNLPDRDGIVRLLDAIYTCIDCGKQIDEDRYVKTGEWYCPDGHKGLDGVGGLYVGKDDPPIPFVFGNPEIPGDMTVLNVQQAAIDNKVVECNGIPQGFTLVRMGLFEKMSKPWFKTLAGVNGAYALTQDLYFCKKAKEELGARFAIDCGAKVGHIDIKTGRVY